MNIHKFIRDLKTVKKERDPRFKERFTWRQGTQTLCESKEHYEYLDTFTNAMSTGDIKPEEFSIRELFEECVPDGRELVRTFDPRHGPGSSLLLEAAGAVSSSDFSTISGQIVYTRLIERMNAEENVFTKLIPTQSTPFSGEKIAGIAGLGDLAEIVNEGEEYPLIGTTQDWIESPATTKRGFIVPITKEAIFFDRTGQLLNECSKVGESLAGNKEKRAVDCVIDENTTTHRYKWRGTTYVTYVDTPWDNLSATTELLDWTDIDACNLLLNSMLDPNTGQPIVVEADTLICGKQLEMTARRIQNATNVTSIVPGYATSGNPTNMNSPNPLAGMFEVVTSRMVGFRQATDTSWYWGNPRKAFVYMENWPIAVIRQDEGHDMFHRDIVTQFRCSERGQYFTVEPRYMVKATVA